MTDLLEEAKEALDRGDLRRAINCFLELEKLENDPEWARRAAQLYLQLGDMIETVEALNRAARAALDRGDILKSAVLSKQILEINPRHVETLLRVPELRDLREAELKSRGLTSLKLSSMLATERRGVGLHAIKLDDEIGDDQPLVLEGEREELIEAVEEEVLAAQKTTDALRSTLFTGTNAKTFQSLLMNARLVELKKDQELFHQGDAGDALYVIAGGTMGVIDEGPPRKGVAKLGEGQFFGEIALLTNQPRSSTLTALSDAQLIAIDREIVRKLIATDPLFLGILLRFFRDRSVENLLSTNQLFTVLSDSDRTNLKKRFRFLEADTGALLIEQGKKAEGLFILLAGRAEVLRTLPTGTTKLGELSPGDIAGEISLLTNIPAMGTVRATEKCWAIELPAAAFQKIVHSRPDAMAFIQRVIDQRVSKSKAIISGAGV
jgi:CRP-like cAMP-binding protein